MKVPIKLAKWLYFIAIFQNGIHKGRLAGTPKLRFAELMSLVDLNCAQDQQQ